MISSPMLKCLPLLALALLAACATHRPEVWSADAAANWANEVVILNDANGRPLTKVRRARVRLLVDAEKRLEPVAGISAVLYLSQSDEPNGYASVGADGKNNIAVTLGMLELIGDDADECAALVGHELAHLTLGHGAKRREREENRQLGSAITGFALTLARVPMGASAADVASTAIERTYTRDEEREADAKGLEYARAAGFDPQGAVRLWEQLSKVQPGSGPLQVLSTHPASAERLEAMRRSSSAEPGK